VPARGAGVGGGCSGDWTSAFCIQSPRGERAEVQVIAEAKDTTR
jgi:hypothetical protein